MNVMAKFFVIPAKAGIHIVIGVILSLCHFAQCSFAASSQPQILFRDSFDTPSTANKDIYDATAGSAPVQNGNFVLTYSSSQDHPPGAVECSLPESPQEVSERVIDLSFPGGGAQTSNSLFVAYAVGAGEGWSLPPLAAGVKPNDRTGYILRLIRHGDGTNEIKMYRNDGGWTTELLSDWKLPFNPVTSLRRIVIRHDNSGLHEIALTFSTPVEKSYSVQDSTYLPDNEHRRLQLILKGHASIDAHLQMPTDTWVVTDVPTSPLTKGGSRGVRVSSNLYVSQIKSLESELTLQKKLPGWNLKVAELLTRQADIYKLKDRGKAEELYREALIILGSAAKPDTRATAGALTGLAELCASRGNFVEAAGLYQRAIEIERVIPTLTALAWIYFHDLHRPGDAESLYEQAINLSDKSGKPAGPELGQSLQVLGDIRRNQKRLDEAERLFKHALAIEEKSVGSDHPDVAKILHKLSRVCRAARRYAEAEAHSKRAVSIKEKALGPTHPYLADSLNNLANLYLDQKKFSEAEALYKRALSIMESNWGPDHPQLLPTLDNLALLYQKLGRSPESESFRTRAQKIKSIQPQTTKK